VDQKTAGHISGEGSEFQAKIEEAKGWDAKATALRKDGSYQDALVVSKKAYRRRVDLLGPEADLTISSLADVAITLAMQEKYRLAARYLETVVRIGMRKWGPTKSFVRRARQALQRMYDHLWMKSEGLELATALIADSQKHLGLTDRETLTEKHSLGSHYYHWGQYAKALVVFESIVEAQATQFGKGDKDTLQTWNSIGACYSAIDDKKKSEGCFTLVQVYHAQYPPKEKPGEDDDDKTLLFTNEALARVLSEDRCSVSPLTATTRPTPPLARCEPIQLDWPATLTPRPANVIRDGDSGEIRVIGVVQGLHGDGSEGHGEGKDEYSCFEDDGDGDLTGEEE